MFVVRVVCVMCAMYVVCVLSVVCVVCMYVCVVCMCVYVRDRDTQSTQRCMLHRMLKNGLENGLFQLF